MRLPVSAIVWFLVLLFTFPTGVKAFGLPIILEYIVCGAVGWYAGTLLEKISKEYSK